MSKQDDRTSAEQMLAHAREASEAIMGLSDSEFLEDRFRTLAAARLLEILGEAANRLSPEFKAKHPDLPYREMISIRNLLIHGYDIVDDTILYNTIKNHLPALIQSLKEILKQE